VNRYLTLAVRRVEAALLVAWNPVKTFLRPVLSPIVRPLERREDARMARQYAALASLARSSDLPPQLARELAEIAADYRLRASR
jgi:hypothetical protein